MLKLRNNLPFRERIALKELRSNTEIVIKRVDKGTTTVIMSKDDEIQEGEVQRDDRKNYTPLEAPMAQETSQKVQEIINDLHQGGHIDTMTKTWLSQTPCLSCTGFNCFFFFFYTGCTNEIQLLKRICYFSWSVYWAFG